MPLGDADVDLQERARCGDVDAYRALVELWTGLAGTIAVLLARDRLRAAAAVRDAFAGAWSELPTLHSEHPFRPWLMGKVVDAALARMSETPVSTPVRAALDGMTEDARVAAVLGGGVSFPAAEVALARGMNIGRATKLLRAALKEFAAALQSAGVTASPRDALKSEARLDLPSAFFDETILPRLRQRPVTEVRRMIVVDPRAAWSVVIDPAATEVWTAMTSIRSRTSAVLRPGARIAGKGRIAGTYPSKDETLVTRGDEERLLAWRTRSTPSRRRGAIEFRWSIEVLEVPKGCELVHTLHGVAFPYSVNGRLLRRLYGKVSYGMQSSMHQGVERLASFIETRARSAT